MLKRDVVYEQVRRNKAVISALSASVISTLSGYPLDSLKSRLQASRTPITVPKLAATVWREEGIAGFYRGFWIPLITISFVRSSEFRLFCGGGFYLSILNTLFWFLDRCCIIYGLQSNERNFASAGIFCSGSIRRRCILRHDCRNPWWDDNIVYKCS